MIVLITTTTLFAHEANNLNITANTSIEDVLIQKDDIQRLKEVKTSYHNGKLRISGIHTLSNIAIYNLLGRKVVDLKNVAINGTYSKYLDLPRNNIYIVKISSSTFSKTFKIVAK